jgi:ABC-type polar amino acid transport system ATPase subunit
VAIARALAMRPQVLLLDEVTSALDPELVAGVLDVLRDIARTTDITMLCVTHEMNFARDISDRVLMFDSGRVIESGPPEKIFEIRSTPEPASSSVPSSPLTRACMELPSAATPWGRAAP